MVSFKIFNSSFTKCAINCYVHLILLIKLKCCLGGRVEFPLKEINITNYSCTGGGGDSLVLEKCSTLIVAP